MDFSKRTDKELRNLLENHRKQNQTETILLIINEMRRRGMATSREYAALKWNQIRVRETLDPFKRISESVPNNARTAYTEAGGRKIGRSKDDPDRLWIDSYCAIKTPKTNSIIVCQIAKPGDEPTFVVRIDDNEPVSFNADQLDGALSKWSEIATKARS